MRDGLSVATTVLKLGHSLEMVRIDAITIVALMVYSEAVRNRTNKMLIRKSSSDYLTTWPRQTKHRSVADSGRRGRPQPATTIWLRNIVAMKSFDCRYQGLSPQRSASTYSFTMAFIDRFMTVPVTVLPMNFP
jgi:hypothetical protein